jgi:hypothetical protein
MVLPTCRVVLVLTGSADRILDFDCIFVGVIRWSDLLEWPMLDVSAVRFPFLFSTSFHSSKIGSGALFGSVQSFCAPPRLRCFGMIPVAVLLVVADWYGCISFGGCGLEILRCLGSIGRRAGGANRGFPPWALVVGGGMATVVVGGYTAAGLTGKGMYCSSGFGSPCSSCSALVGCELGTVLLVVSDLVSLTCRSASIVCCRRSIFASRSWNFKSFASISCIL